jgi:hypothetical protein
MNYFRIPEGTTRNGLGRESRTFVQFLAIKTHSKENINSRPQMQNVFSGAAKERARCVDQRRPQLGPGEYGRDGSIPDNGR